MLKALFRFLTAPFRWLGKGFYALILRSPLKEFFEEEPDDTPILDTIQKAADEPKDFFMSLLEHVNELRKHLFRAAFAMVITTAVAFFFTEQILDWLAQPIGGINELQAIEVTEPVGVVMRVALITGFVVALPYITFEVLRFLAPGISRRARIMSLFAIPFVAIFFIAGMTFAYYFMLPTALPFLLNFMGIPTMPRPSSYIRFTTGLMFWIGASFEFPLVSFILSSMGILSPKALRDNWRLAFIILAVLAAMITPTIDPINMMIVLLPLWLLYGLSIVMAYIAQGRRTRRQAAE